MRISFTLFLPLFFCLFFPPLILSADTRLNVITVRHQSFQPFEMALKGFQKELAASDFHNRVKIVEHYNAHSNLKELDARILRLTKQTDIDLIFSLGTHSTKRLVQSIDHIPIIFTIVGDPERAGIVSSWQSSGTNYTGVETPQYYSKVVRLMHQYIPFRRLGMIYLLGSPSHEAGIRQLNLLAKSMNFELVVKGFPLRNAQKIPFPKEIIRENITASLEAVCPHVDAFFVQTSKTFSENFDLFHTAFVQHHLVSAGDPTNIKKGLVMGIGKDAYRFGEQCARYAIKILQGTLPAALPMDVGGKLTIEVNLKAAEQIGFSPPFELLSATDNLYQSVLPEPNMPNKE